MKEKFYNKFAIYSASVSGIYYLGHAAYEWNKQDEFNEKLSRLNDKMMDRLIDILSNADISKAEKFRYDFMVTKNSFHFDAYGNFYFKRKLIALPFYFEFEDEEENDYGLINKSKDENYPNLSNLDLLKHKDLFKMTPKELEFAVLYEIYKTYWDYKILDAFGIALFGLFAGAITHLINFPKSNFGKISLSTLIALVLSYVFIYVERQNYLNLYATNKIINSNNLDLLESGLKYLNKRIQLDQLLGKDVTLSKKQFEKIRSASETLKERKLKLENLKKLDKDEEIDESAIKNALIAKKIKIKNMPKVI